MATVFNRSFEFICIPQTTHDAEGTPIPGVVSRRMVQGTVQPISGKDTVPDSIASRNSGSVKVYSSERLEFRSVDGNGRGFVKCGDMLYELMDELPFLNMPGISHWKYIGCLVPPHMEPAELFVTEDSPGF